MNYLADTILLIELHHERYPDHGIDCACMDQHIKQMRRMTLTDNADAQRRVDYVLRKALDTRQPR